MANLSKNNSQTCWNAPAISKEVKLKTMTSTRFLITKLLFPSWALWIFLYFLKHLGNF